MLKMRHSKEESMNLVAKPIVKNQLWVVTDGTSKVGNVEFTNAGYNLKLGGWQSVFGSTKDIQNFAKIEFVRPKRTSTNGTPYAVWPTTGKTYNNMFDVKRKLHLYTKTKKSKCYHAAGWFNIKMGETWQTVFCPKYIFIQRYNYVGPFFSQDEAESTK